MSTINLTPIIHEHVKMYNRGNKKAFTQAAFEKSLLKTAKKHKMSGEGLFSWIKQGYEAIKRFLDGPRLGFSPKVRQFLQKYGNEQILGLTVARRPVVKAIEDLANWISDGKYEKINKN